MGPNGSGELNRALERIIESFGWLRKAVEAMSDKLSETSERREREHEALRRILADIEKAVALLHGQVGEARDDIEKVREDTDPRGFRLLDPDRYPLPAKKDGSGPALALTESKFKLHMPSSWALFLLKLVLSAGVGAALLRFGQWVIGRR